MTYNYPYPRPAVTVDCVLFGRDTINKTKILLIRRKNEPFKDCWALPGGFVDLQEDLLTAAQRELQEETGISNVILKQLYTFGAPYRDPRGHTISVAYFGNVNIIEHKVQAADDATEVLWHCLNALPDMAFDHDAIINKALEKHPNI